MPQSDQAKDSHLNSNTNSREYERSGLYPENGKAFRIWALLAWLAGTVIVLAGVSALLNHLLLN